MTSLVQRNKSSQSERGTPRIHATTAIGSGAEMRSTKSHSRASVPVAALSRISTAMRSMSSRRARSELRVTLYREAEIGESARVRMRYASNIEAEVDLVNALTAALEQKRPLDLRRGLTHAGPHRDDLVIGLSTSGRSPNVIEAIRAARQIGARTVALLGEQGELADLADMAIRIPSQSVPRIQEAHMFIGHLICEMAQRMTTGEYQTRFVPEAAHT